VDVFPTTYTQLRVIGDLQEDFKGEQSVTRLGNRALRRLQLIVRRALTFAAR
jgi:hypothetical protein